MGKSEYFLHQKYIKQGMFYQRSDMCNSVSDEERPYEKSDKVVRQIDK